MDLIYSPHSIRQTVVQLCSDNTVYSD